MATPGRLQLVKFGALVAELRRQLSPAVSQADLGRRLVEAMGPGEAANYDQTFVAKLEKGLITNPSKEFLRALSKALDDANYGRLLGALVADKYLDEEKQQIASFLNKGALTLQELAKWEGRTEHEEVWIVAEQLYDTDMPDLQGAVKSILSEGGSAVFFLNQENEFKFEGFRDEMAQADGMAKINLAEKLLLIKLQPKQSAVLAAPFVIANPTKPEREGYIVLSDDLGPSVAVKMSVLETHRRMDSLRALKSAYIREQRETK